MAKIKRTTQEKTYKEFEEAPSGEVFFYNYKEPLMIFKEGFGYQGALIFDSTSQQIQCHFCGGWFDYLGNHLHKEHNMTAPEYKKKVGLNTSSALISEPLRAKLIAKGLEKRIKNLRPNKTHSAASRAKISATLRENRAEKQNRNNTCPEQLLERLTVLYNKLGRTPRFHGTRLVTGKKIHGEVPFVEALERVYGSIKNACKMANIPYREPGTTLRGTYAPGINKARCVDFVREFYNREKRLPEYREWNQRLYNSMRDNHLSKKEIYAEALGQDGIFKPINFIVHYDKETLIDFLKIFKIRNSRYPSASDCRRKLLPNASKYAYQFGSWKKALKIAFPDRI